MIMSLWQLGLGDESNRGDDAGDINNNFIETQLGISFIPIQMCTRWYFTCALSQNYQIKCYGASAYGQTGIAI